MSETLIAEHPQQRWHPFTRTAFRFCLRLSLALQPALSTDGISNSLRRQGSRVVQLDLDLASAPGRTNCSQ